MTVNGRLTTAATYEVLSKSATASPQTGHQFVRLVKIPSSATVFLPANSVRKSVPAAESRAVDRFHEDRAQTPEIRAADGANGDRSRWCPICRTSVTKRDCFGRPCHIPESRPPRYRVSRRARRRATSGCAPAAEPCRAGTIPDAKGFRRRRSGRRAVSCIVRTGSQRSNTCRFPALHRRVVWPLLAISRRSQSVKAWAGGGRRSGGWVTSMYSPKLKVRAPNGRTSAPLAR